MKLIVAYSILRIVTFWNVVNWNVKTNVNLIFDLQSGGSFGPIIPPKLNPLIFTQTLLSNVPLQLIFVDDEAINFEKLRERTWNILLFSGNWFLKFFPGSQINKLNSKSILDRFSQGHHDDDKFARFGRGRRKRGRTGTGRHNPVSPGNGGCLRWESETLLRSD